MAIERLGIIMNGVTGRMGTNQHLIRSICAIRNEGGVRLADGRRVMPDPILVGRNADKLAALAAANGVTRWSTDLNAALANKDDTVYFDSASTGLRPKLIKQGHRRRQAHLYRKAGGADRPRSNGPLPRGEGRGHQARRGAGQALAAGPAQDEDAGRLRILRPHPVSAGRVRLLGVRRRLAARAATVVELSQGRRRRNHRRHALPLALSCSTISGAKSKVSPVSARRIFQSAGTSTAASTRQLRTMQPTRPSSLPARTGR